jgi:hypothetical protein
MSNVINNIHVSTSSRHSGHVFKPKIDPYSSLPPTYLECDCGFQIEHRIDEIKSAFLKYQPNLDLPAFKLEFGVHSYYWDTRFFSLSNCPKKTVPTIPPPNAGGPGLPIVSNGKVVGWTLGGPSMPATPATGVNSWGIAASNAPLMSVKHQGCECGAYKVMSASKGQVGHSSWCPWAAGNSHKWILLPLDCLTI